jgi:hypothetical protein
MAGRRYPSAIADRFYDGKMGLHRRSYQTSSCPIWREKGVKKEKEKCKRRRINKKKKMEEIDEHKLKEDN